MVSVWNDVSYVSEVIRASATRMEVLERLGRSTTSAMYRRLKLFEMTNDIDTSHYKPYNSTNRKTATDGNRTLSHDDIFKCGSAVSQSVVRRRVIRDNLVQYVCTGCGCGDTWNGKHITLQLDHIDGDSTNHTLTNLRFLCPNCHSQTDTFCGKNTEYKKQTTNKADYTAQLHQAAIQRNQPLVNAVLQSGIDFTKYGWSKQVALLLGKTPQKVKDWMMRYMKEFYETKCYHRQR